MQAARSGNGSLRSSQPLEFYRRKGNCGRRTCAVTSEHRDRRCKICCHLRQGDDRRHCELKSKPPGVLSMKSALEILEQVRVASPCPVRWESMTGDARVRRCSQCERQVFSLSSMTADEALNLIYRTRGEVCVQLW